MSATLARATVDATWRGLTSWPTPFQSPAWYQAAGFASSVIPVSAGDQGGSPAALVPVWEVREPAHYYHAPRSVLFGEREERLASDGAGLRSLRAADWGASLVTVSPFGYRGGAIAAVEQPPGVFRELALALVGHARRRGARVLLSHFLFEDEDGRWIRALVEVGGIPLVLGAQAVLPVSWSSVDEYLSRLHQGHRSLRERQERGDPGLAWTAHDHPGPGPGQGGLASLLRERLLRHDQAAAPLSLLEAIVEGASMPRVLFSVGELGAPARSGLAALVQGTTLYPKFVAAARADHDYFPLVFARVVEYAIAKGYRMVDYGGGSHQAKLARGCGLRFALGVVFFFDSRLLAVAAPAARQLSRAKVEDFRALARRWHPQEVAPAMPAVLQGLDRTEESTGSTRSTAATGT
ncbi:MAG: hypothetical protein E6J00_01975 [Chloroflexi bacterium]|nr:MAG: hypothetical protein E6J00_01975 [Chloroflexota bacterium]